MALKDAIDKIVSYFDTDEVTDYEDAAKEEAKERPVKAQKPVRHDLLVSNVNLSVLRQQSLLVANMFIQTYRKLKSFVVYL